MTKSESNDQRAGDLSVETFSERLQSGLGLQIGPFKAYLQVLCPEIAETLHISHSTVKTHLANLMPKLDARNRVELAIWTYETGRMKA